MMPATFADALATMHFLRPDWLWALLLLPLAVLAWRLRARRASVWRQNVDAHLLLHLLQPGGERRGFVAPMLAVFALALGIVALAGPSWRKDAQPLLRGAAPLVVALDLSSATTASDLPPSRLLQARAKLATLLENRTGGQVGLVAFADDAFTVSPLTDDADNVALFLDSLSPDVMPVDGSRAGRAIRESVRLLKQAGFERGDILVLSDHADADARGAAAAAVRDGYRVSAIGLGTAAGAAYRTAQGGFAQARLDANSLRSMAADGGGRYAALTSGTSDLAAVGALDARATQSTASGAETTVWRDEGYWLLLPLMLVALFAFRRGGMFAAVLVVACLPLRPAAAADEGTFWRRADQVQHARMQQGADAFRKKNYAAAEQAWSALPAADAAYNRGNALAQAGRYEDAIAAYDKALQQQPGMDDALANKRAVQDAMNRKPPPSKKPNGRGKQQQSKNGRPNDGKSDPQDGASPPSDNRTDGQQPSDAKDKPPSGTPGDGQDSPADDAKQNGQTREPNDAKAQADADAEQRKRMQQALQGKQGEQPEEKDGAPGSVAQAKPGDAADRERQRANDAWLKRVPDDPGGLLRAKFQLEYERRQESGER